MERIEKLSPQEATIRMLLEGKEHLFHGRPGIELPGGRWVALNDKSVSKQYKENRERYQRWAKGEKVTPVGGGQFLKPGVHVAPTVKTFRQMLDIWRTDNEFAGRLASHILLNTDHKDLKVLAAALMLVQGRHGQEFKEDGESFRDIDLRDVGVAMVGYYDKGSDKMFNPKMVEDIRAILSIPEIWKMVRTSGFGDPDMNEPFLGRYEKAVDRFIRYRETNFRMLEGAVGKGGFKQSFLRMARLISYRPDTERFYKILGWKQSQHKKGYRKVGIGMEMERVSFQGKSEEEIVKIIKEKKIGYKVVVGMLPKEIGLTKAIMEAIAPQLSDKELVILSPTLEDLGLLKAKTALRKRWEEACAAAVDQRAANVLKNVRDVTIKKVLQDSADNAMAKAAAKAVEGRKFKMILGIDTSSSMQGAIEKGKTTLGRVLPGFKDRPDDVFVVAFQRTARQITFPAGKDGKPAMGKTAIELALKGLEASGGTIYGSAIACAKDSGFKVADDEALIIMFIGDESDADGRTGEDGTALTTTIQALGYKPSAVVFLPHIGNMGRGQSVRGMAAKLQLPYTEATPEDIPENDPYQLTRWWTNVLSASIPAKVAAGRAAPRSVLIEQILNTPLLTTANPKVCLA